MHTRGQEHRSGNGGGGNGAPGNGAKATTDRQLGEPGFLRNLLRWKRLESVFLFVTSRCNSKCKTCFYSEELNSGKDMTFEQIRRISETAPRFDKLWLSGGEPFMRRDLVDIIALFHENNGVSTINLPTNGMLTERIDAAMDELLERCPELNVHLNYSLDGFAPTHDEVRGVKGAFDKTMATMELMARKHRSNARLVRNVATVITPDSYDELFELAVDLLGRDLTMLQFFETVRGSPRDPATKRLTTAQLVALHERLLPLHEAMSNRLFAEIPAQGRWIAKLFFMGVIRLMYQLHEQNLEGPTDWGMDCVAGKTTIVVDHDGSFRSCEMRPPIGHLADFDFDLAAALHSDEMVREIAQIGGGAGACCWCTHSCWIISSMKFSPSTLLFRVPWLYLQYQFAGRLAGLFGGADRGGSPSPYQAQAQAQTQACQAQACQAQACQAQPFRGGR